MYVCVYVCVCMYVIYWKSLIINGAHWLNLPRPLLFATLSLKQAMFTNIHKSKK